MVERMLESGQVVAARYVLLRKLGAGRTSEVWLAREAGECSRVRAEAAGTCDADATHAREASCAARGCSSESSIRTCCAACRSTRPIRRTRVCEYCARGDASQLRGRPWQELVPMLECRRGRRRRACTRPGSCTAISSRATCCSRTTAPRSSRTSVSRRPSVTRRRETAGSPFSASPQQLAGEPPAIADDLYGFGALCCELLTGYPPHYPDVAESRARGEPLRLRTEPAAAAEARGAAASMSRRRSARSTGGHGHRALDLARDRSRRSIASRQQPLSRFPRCAHRRTRRRHRTAVAPARGRPHRMRSSCARRVSAVDCWPACLRCCVIGAGVVFVALPKWVAKPVAQHVTPAAHCSRRGNAAQGENRRRSATSRRDQARSSTSCVRRSPGGCRRWKARHVTDWGGETFTRGKGAFTAADTRYAAARPTRPATRSSRPRTPI